MHPSEFEMGLQGFSICPVSKFGGGVCVHLDPLGCHERPNE